MKSKKQIISAFIVVLSLLGLPAFSQIRFGVKADVGLNNPKFSTEALKVENMTTYSIGPSVEVTLPVPSIDLCAEASLLYNDNRTTVASLKESSGEKNISNRYLMLPVNAKLKFGLGNMVKLYGAAGPYAGYRIAGDKIDFGKISEEVKAKAFQAGVNLGVGVEVIRMVQVGLNYRVQLTDNYAADEPNWKDPLNGKNQTWSITAAVYF